MPHTTATIGRDRYSTHIVAGGHPFTADEPEAMGGADAGPASYDLLLASLGACTAITLRMYADRKEWPMEKLEVRLQIVGDKDNRHIRRDLTVEGLDDAQRARLADIAERTPVTLTLKGGIPIDTHMA
jgi:putative redox protein